MASRTTYFEIKTLESQPKTFEYLKRKLQKTQSQDLAPPGSLVKTTAKKAQVKKKKSHAYHQEYLEFTHEDLRSIRSLPPVTMNDLKSKKVTLPSLDRHKKTVIFDLDETLVHCCSSREPAEVYLKFFNKKIGINVRPFALELLRAVRDISEVIVFTASQQDYADVVLDFLDPQGDIFQHRLYRDSCILIGDLFVKDLRIFENRKLSDIVLVDNMPHSYAFQIHNGIPITSWYDEKDDQELVGLLDYLKWIQSFSDVRFPNKETFKFCSALKKS